MNDQQIIEYLRSRGRAEPPADLTWRVMEAVDAAGTPTLRFGAFVPAVALAAVVAAVAILALGLGPGPNVGPSPSESAAPSSPSAPSTSAESATLDELEAAVIAATERLRASDAVHGWHTYEIEGYLASATWFDWRPSGEQVVVTRTDVDVSAPWWTDPEGEPLTVGERIREEVNVIVGDGWYRAVDGAWIVASRDEAPPILAFGVGLPSGEITPLAGIDPATVSRVTRHGIVGGESWTVEIRDGEATGSVEWTIVDGVLSRYAVVGVNIAAEPEFGLGNVTTHSIIDLTHVDAPSPIPEPDPTGLPDPGSFGLPAAFPLVPDARESSAPSP